MNVKLDEYCHTLQVLDEHCTKVFVRLRGGIEIKNIFNCPSKQYAISDGCSYVVFNYEMLDGGFELVYHQGSGEYHCNFITEFHYIHPDQAEFCE